MTVQRLAFANARLLDDGRSVVTTVFNENSGSILGDDEARVERYDLADRTVTTIVEVDGLPFDFSLSDATPNGATIALDTASKLVPEDDNSDARGGFSDVYTLDAATGTIALESVTPDGGTINDNSFGGRLSADGRFLVFNGTADDLTPNDTNGQGDVYLRDRTTGETVNLTQTRTSQTKNLFPEIAGFSDDGNTVLVRAFNPNGSFDRPNDGFYVLDVAGRDLTRLDVDFDGGLGELTADGGEAFLDAGETRGDIVRVDLATGAQETRGRRPGTSFQVRRFARRPLLGRRDRRGPRPERRRRRQRPLRARPRGRSNLPHRPGRF